MTPDSLHSTADIAQIVAGFASMAALVVASIAAYLLVLQTRTNAHISRESSALDTHRDYLKICIDRPELSSSQAMLNHLKRTSFEGIEDEVSPETERALWFLSYVLHTSEQLLETSGKDKIWTVVVSSQLSFHADLITVVWPNWKKHYGKRLTKLVEESVFTAR